jgi:hypothetical protein
MAAISFSDFIKDGSNIGDFLSRADQTGSSFIACGSSLHDVSGLAGNGGGRISLDEDSLGTLGAMAINLAA